MPRKWKSSKINWGKKKKGSARNSRIIFSMMKEVTLWKKVKRGRVNKEKKNKASVVKMWPSEHEFKLNRCWRRRGMDTPRTAGVKIRDTVSVPRGLQLWDGHGRRSAWPCHVLRQRPQAAAAKPQLCLHLEWLVAASIYRVRAVFEGLGKFEGNGIRFSRPWKSVKTLVGSVKVCEFCGNQSAREELSAY